MAKNNHSDTDNKTKLEKLLKVDRSLSGRDSLNEVTNFAKTLARIENALVVISDMTERRSHIFMGGFGKCLGLNDYHQEESIWEKRILSLMTKEEQEEKYIAELRFFHYLRHLPKNKRKDHYLISKLRFRFADGNLHNVLHRMYYILDDDNDTVKYAVCIYSPMIFDFKGKSHVVDSTTGISEELTYSSNVTILSNRERQVLSLIDSGMRSSEIAQQLNISIHTVSRHRQEILSKLQVKNSHEACCIAKNIGLI